MVTKFHIGVNEEIPIAPEFFFQVGLQYIGKGAKGPIPYRYTDLTVPHTTTITREISMNYLEMPLNLVYKPLVGKGNFILGGGPYVGYAISGKAKYTGSPAPSDRDITFTKTTPDNDENNLANFKHLKHHLGLLAMEKRLLKHYGIMEKVGSTGGDKNRRN